jgi:hypothetical protein
MLGVAALASGCAPDVCGGFGGQSCIALHLRAAAGSTVAPADEVDIDITGTLHQASHKMGGAASLPIVLAVLPGAALQGIPIAITLRAGGGVVGTGSAVANVAPAQHTEAFADITGVARPPDLNASVADLAHGDDSGGVVGPPCNLTMQSSCGAGEKCALGPSGGVCAPDGTVAVGGACSGTPDDCIHGSVCLGGVCHQLCVKDSDCSQAPVDKVPPRCGDPVPNVINKACTIACSAAPNAGPSGCLPSYACVYNPSPTTEGTDCAMTGSGSDGTTCASNTDCASGLTCILNGAPPGHCRRVCRNGVAADCSGLAGYTCNGVGSVYGTCCPAAGC